MMIDWDNYFLDGARWVSTKSKDTSTKVGCIIVSTSNEILSTGFNGMPRNIDDNVVDRYERPEKYAWFEHAERNAIYNAARNGVMLLDSVCYITCPPCIDCSRGLIQAGIREVIWPKDNPFECDSEALERWGESINKSKLMLREAGISLTTL